MRPFLVGVLCTVVSWTSIAILTSIDVYKFGRQLSVDEVSLGRLQHRFYQSRITPIFLSSSQHSAPVPRFSVFHPVPNLQF